MGSLSFPGAFLQRRPQLHLGPAGGPGPQTSAAAWGSVGLQTCQPRGTSMHLTSFVRMLQQPPSPAVPLCFLFVCLFRFVLSVKSPHAMKIFSTSDKIRCLFSC